MSTEKQVMSLWAKKEERNGRFFWLPLKVHLTDTMNVSRWLWTNWLSDSQRQFCINSISISDEEVAANLAAFLGAVHDIGKATPAFQIQKGFHNSPDLDGLLLEKLEMAGFLGISSLILAEPRKTHHSIAGEFLLTKEFHIKDDIGSIIGAHHGKPIDDRFSLEDQSAYPANYYQSEDDGSDIYHTWQQVHYELFHWALDASGFESVEELPEISQPAQVIYSGLLIMADWISSNSNYYPLMDIDSEHETDIAARYREGVAAWYQNMPIQIHSYPAVEQLFLHRFGFEPRAFQKASYQAISHIKKPGIIILEAPMGLGKTEAALTGAEIFATKTGCSGLFFGLPTQATSNGMFGRIHEWLETITEEYGIKQSLRLCHGKAALNDEMNSLRETILSQNINVDEDTNGSVFVNEWFSGRKKTALDDFVVGTVDGFLLTALKQKHLALRHLGFSKKIVIIDEVHAYDTYMQQYLQEAIQWMGAYGTPVILISATLPGEKRKELITAYLKGTGVKKREIHFPEAIADNKYPLISYTDGNMVKINTDFEPMEDKVVKVKTLNDEELEDKVEELIKEGGVIGIIVNTVRKAQKIGEEFKERFGRNTVEILHSAFIATDRIDKETALISRIGKHGKRPERKIIIGTQVIEQSLDIDFDALITDLCPVDLLLQRVGRLQRHEIKRPVKFSEPVVYVLGTSDHMEFDQGSERVYGKYYLLRTQLCLPDYIRIPSDIPILIDEVYGGSDPALTGQLMSIFQESRNEMDTLKNNKTDKAKTYRINEPKREIKPGKYNLIGWLKNPDYSNSEEMAAAQVRDIMETIEVIAVKRIGNGYGTFKNEIDISGQIDDPKVAKELAKHTLRLPNYVTLGKGISNTITDLEDVNLKYLSDWQNQSWLKGSLGIIFDENGCFELNGIRLKYDNELGLREENEDGKV